MIGRLSASAIATHQLMCCFLVGVVLAEPVIWNITSNQNLPGSLKLFLQLELNNNFSRSQTICEHTAEMRFEIKSNLQVESKQPRRVTVREGASLELTCKIDCNSNEASLPRLAKLNDKLAPFSRNESRLFLTRVDLTHSGRYICYEDDERALFQYLDVVVESTGRPVTATTTNRETTLELTTRSEDEEATTAPRSDIEVDVQFYFSGHRNLTCETELVISSPDFVQISQLRKIHDVVVSWHLTQRVPNRSATYQFPSRVSDGVYTCSIRIRDATKYYYLIFRNGKSRVLSSGDIFAHLNIYDYNNTLDQPNSPIGDVSKSQGNEESIKHEFFGSSDEPTLESEKAGETTTNVGQETSATADGSRMGLETATSNRPEIETSPGSEEPTETTDQPDLEIQTSTGKKSASNRRSEPELTPIDQEWTTELEIERTTRRFFGSRSSFFETSRFSLRDTTEKPTIGNENTTEQLSTEATTEKAVKTTARPEIEIEFSCKIERQFVTLNCSIANGLVVEYIEIRRKNGRRISSIENSNSLQIRMRKWQLADEHVLFCSVQDGYVTREESLLLPV